MTKVNQEMKMNELWEVAKEHGIKFRIGVKKADLIMEINKAQEDEEKAKLNREGFDQYTEEANHDEVENILEEEYLESDEAAEQVEEDNLAAEMLINGDKEKQAAVIVGMDLSVSDKIRQLTALGVLRKDVAKLLEIRYQFVRNVLVRDAEKRESQ